jgi:biopolymer transport protein ExbD
MDDRGFESMNVIPLVDVMLVLLTIVLTTSTFIAVGAIKVSLPKATAETSRTQQPLTITIDRAGAIYLAAEPTTLEALDLVLAATAKETPVLIRADHRIDLQSFVNVLDRIKKVGFTAVSLQTEVLP